VGRRVRTYPAQLSEEEQAAQERLLSAAVLAAQLHIQKRVKISFGVSLKGDGGLSISVELFFSGALYLMLCAVLHSTVLSHALC